MFDGRLRPLVDRTTAHGARWLHERGICAQTVTLAALAAGVSGAVAIAASWPLLGLALILANRLGDGLDGAVARIEGPTDRGGYLDIVLDFVIYAAVPLAFAVADPGQNALAAVVLLAAFLVNAVAFLAFAIMAEKRALQSQAQGLKSFYFLAGFAEGFETIVAFCLMCLIPAWFSEIALMFAAVCAVSALARMAVAWRALN